MLSQPERRQLREIEQWLEESDPDLTRVLREGIRKRRSLNRTAVRITLAVVCAVLVVLGAALINFPLIVLGIIGIGFAACLQRTGSDRGRG